MFEDTYRYNSVEVAFYIVAWANKNKVSINLTKAQKLLYIAYGANFIMGGNRLCNEHPQAWPYGPVFPTTRNKLLKEDNLEAITFEHEKLTAVKEDSYLEKLISFVFSGFGNNNSSQLVAWSHQKGSPWERATKQEGFNWGDVIPDEFIYEYFDGLIVRNAQ